jgi:DNA polymerase-1
MTASLIFGVPVEEVQDWQRTSAKSVGFGIVYGLSARGLQLQMKLRGIDKSEEECQAMIDGYLRNAYPGVRALMEEKQREGRRDGFVRSVLGRLRYLPALHSTNTRLRSESERICLNHVIQCTAQEVIKLGMVGIWTNVLPCIWKEGWYCEPLLQIHDELILEFDERIAGELDVLVRTELEHAIQLLVPIGSKGHMAPTWGGLK